MAAGGISAALLVPDAGANGPGNIITAGHLQVEINQGVGSSLSIDNLAPGETRTAYQLVSGEMAGVGTASLTLTLAAAGDKGNDGDGDDPGGGGTAAADDDFMQQATIAVDVSAPASADTLGWSSSDETCGPSVHYADVLTAETFASVSSAAQLALAPAGSTSAGQLTEAADAVCVRFTVSLASTARNPVQGKTGTLTMTYDLAQTSAVTS